MDKDALMMIEIDKVSSRLISNAGQKPAEGWFLSKWVYKFCPSQKLVHLSGYFNIT